MSQYQNLTSNLWGCPKANRLRMAWYSASTPITFGPDGSGPVTLEPVTVALAQDQAQDDQQRTHVQILKRNLDNHMKACETCRKVFENESDSE